MNDFNNAVELERAKGYIDDYCRREFEDESGGDFTVLSKIGIAYTTTEDDLHEIQVNANLCDCSIDTYIDGVLVRQAKYDNLMDLNDIELSCLDFDSLVSVSDEEIKISDMARLKITKEMVRTGYEAEIIKLVESPLGDGVVCQIGDNWFYFGGQTAEENTVEEYKQYVPAEDIIEGIHSVLSEDFYTEFTEEYLYYSLYLRERGIKG